MSTPRLAGHDENSTRDTYRALRVGMVGAGLLLLVAVILECLRMGDIPGSVSATFYSPVRSIFVGSLLAVGLALVAIKGRPGWENGLLDIAGILVPLVGFVPTPVVLSSIAGSSELPYSCPDRGKACVPRELSADISNNVGAYVIVGAVTLAFVWFRMVRARGGSEAWRSRTTRAVAVATALWAGLGLWFLVGRESFTEYAHYTSAITFFVLLMVVVWINGRHTEPTNDLLGMTATGYRGWYYAIALAMAAAVVLGLITFLITGQQSGFPVVFWLEVVLLLLFITFWLLQTAEHWNRTTPPPSSGPTG